LKWTMRIIFHFANNSNVFESYRLSFRYWWSVFIVSTTENYLEYFAKETTDWAKKMKYNSEKNQHRNSVEIHLEILHWKIWRKQIEDRLHWFRKLMDAKEKSKGVIYLLYCFSSKVNNQSVFINIRIRKRRYMCVSHIFQLMNLLLE